VRGGERDDLHFGVAQHRREDPVVGPDEPMAVRPHGEGGPRGADARVHDGEVGGAGREPMPCAAEEIGAGADVARRDRVGDVHQHGPGAEAEQHAFHLRHVGIGRAEVGEQGDQRHAQR
jgi:hypothetical protein